MTARADGRDTRWADHRVQRRRELVESTLRAIRKHGASVGMDEIATEAGTSKTVIYRHFGDRSGLYLAVVEKVADFILEDLRASVGWDDPDDLATLVADLVHAYLGLVERDPEIYRFVISRPLVDKPLTEDPVTGLTRRIGRQVGDVLRRYGHAEATAATWGHGLVGFVRAATDEWLAAGMPRDTDQLAADVAHLFAPAFAAHQPATSGIS
ncbi:MAG: TetR/AcrR family transcriptional regulator [Micropruina sp.]|nr:TetR/AcrR family transcriptional regulator [Micropruina sp.]